MNTINLTSYDKLPIIGIPNEVKMLGDMKHSLRKMITPKRVHLLISQLAYTIFTQLSSNVVVIVDVADCDPKVITMLNTYFRVFDVNHATPLSFLSDIQKYGETLDLSSNIKNQLPLNVLDYNFFQIVLKCMCTINTRIGPHRGCPTAISDTEYEQQDFLVLIKKITEEKAFTLEMEGKCHYVAYTHNGWITVDGEPTIELSHLNTKIDNNTVDEDQVEENTDLMEGFLDKSSDLYMDKELMDEFLDKSPSLCINRDQMEDFLDESSDVYMDEELMQYLIMGKSATEQMVNSAMSRIMRKLYEK